MSIQIELVGHVAGSLLHKQAPFAALEGIHEWIEKEFPLQIVSKHFDEEKYTVTLHPYAEPATFEIQGKTILFRALTHSVGPGYHAKLIDTLDQLTPIVHVKWHEHDPHVDQAGFFANRDFDRLKNYFSRWLRHNCLTISDRPPSKYGIPLGIPLTDVEYPGYVLTPMGPRPREWVQTVASGANLGNDFWPWPEKELDAEFFIRYALCIMWSLFDWHGAHSNREKAMMILAHDALVNAFGLDPENAQIPWQAWKELCGISLQQFPATAPNPLPPGPQIGYIRQTADAPLHM